ncbi:MAG TPA: hypothetical protein VGK27_08380 [Candidatus Deferrimicrobiaceae bacterium]|jgi:hypothetical protein
MMLRKGIAWGGIGLFLLAGTPAIAGWEAGAKAGFDTNVSRTIGGSGKSDGFLSAYAGYGREPSGDESRDWFFTAIADGTAHANVSDLDSVSATVAPGLVFKLRPSWTLSVSPFLQAKGVKDSNQSAFDAGGRLQMKQRLQDDLVLGEYYVYTNSHASSDVFSYSEHALGVTLGKTFSEKASAEIGYEYGRGDSFRSTGNSSAGGGGVGGMGGIGSGMPRMFSSAFGSEVVRDRVNRHSVGVSAEYDWTRSIFTAANYTFTTRRGELGSSAAHTGYAGLGYRF